METISMKCQILFSGKNKNISKCQLKILPRVLSINGISWRRTSSACLARCLDDWLTTDWLYFFSLFFTAIEKISNHILEKNQYVFCWNLYYACWAKKLAGLQVKIFLFFMPPAIFNWGHIVSLLSIHPLCILSVCTKIGIFWKAKCIGFIFHTQVYNHKI